MELGIVLNPITRVPNANENAKLQNKIMRNNRPKNTINGLADNVLKWKVSTNTEENAIEARKVMDQYGLKSAVLVTDNFHMLRAEMLFHREHIVVKLSPAQVTAGPLEWWLAVFNSYREVGALAWYEVKTALGLPSTSTRF